LLAALLRLAAMLVVGAVHAMRMPLTLLSRECHTDVERDRLPAPEDGKQTKEQPAEGLSQTPQAFMASSEQGSRTQGQLPLSPLIPAKAGARGSPRSLSRRGAAAQRPGKSLGPHWIPAFAGTSGAMSLN